MNPLKPHLAVASVIFFAAASQALATPPLSSTISGTNGTDYLYWDETSPGIITLNPGASLLGILGGNASAPGGNVELFANSELPSFDGTTAGGAFATAPRTTLSFGFGAGVHCEVTSLNGADWFTVRSCGGLGSYDTSFGTDTLANEWFGGFIAANNTGTPIGANAGLAFNTLRDANFFQSLSDPNVSYADYDATNMVASFGLAGFEDLTFRLSSELVANGVNPLAASFLISNFFPNGISYSEVLRVDGQALYGFNSTPSGVVLAADGSYEANYEVTTIKAIPEPSAAVLGALLSAGLLFRRRR